MSERLLLLFVLAAGAATPLTAQESEVARLERRVANLRVRRAAVAAEVAVRDSIERSATRPRVIGKAPLFLEVPEWAVSRLEPEVLKVVDEATAAYGAAFAQAPAETLAVLYAPLRAPGTERLVRVDRDTSGAAEGYLAARAHDVRRMALDRAGRILGERFLTSIGGRYNGGTFEGSRRRAVVVLASDRSGTGDRCLKGSVEACAAALSMEHGAAGSALRLSLLMLVDRSMGPAGWARLAGSDAEGFEARIAVAAGRPYAEVVAEWGNALRSGGGLIQDADGRIPLAMGWGILFVALFAWRFKWDHV